MAAEFSMELSGAVAVWAAWEALKVTGAAQAIVARMVGKQQTLSDDEKDALDDHFEKCRMCHTDQERQAELRQKTSDPTNDIKTLLTSHR